MHISLQAFREMSSSPAELPREALTEPYVNLSIHTALVTQPTVIFLTSSDTGVTDLALLRL